MKRAEMQKENASNKTTPTHQQRLWRELREFPNHCRTEKRLEHGSNPFAQFWPWSMTMRIEKSACVHSRPGEEIRPMTPHGGVVDRALPPSKPFAAEEKRKRHRPHENPGWHRISENPRDCR